MKLPSRTRFLSAAINYTNCPYVWGGRGPTFADGVDCWGLVYAAMVKIGGPEFFRKWWTDQAFAKLPVVEREQLQPGDLIFYGANAADLNDVNHVVVYLGGGVILSASGGGPKVITVAIAERLNAKVKAMPLYLTGYRGCRTLQEFLSD